MLTAHCSLERLPSVVGKGTLKGVRGKPSFLVGEKVTLRCEEGHQAQQDHSTCLQSGQFDFSELVCVESELFFSLFICMTKNLTFFSTITEVESLY